MAAVLPPEVITSSEIEQRLEPLYHRLRLPNGRLELMTGIRERRFWPVGFPPSEGAASAGQAVLARSALTPESIGLLIHCGVCRDRLEPSTASTVHHLLRLPPKVQFLDISNACLGFINAMMLAASMIESGQIKAALLVSCENGRPLLEHTLSHLLESTLDRNAIKPFFANLTIGAGAVAALLCHSELAPKAQWRFLGGVARADSTANHLCQGDAASGSALQMSTDSEELLKAGLDLAGRTWADLLLGFGWEASDIHRVVCHQVGRAHQRGLLERIGLTLEQDFSTFGNLGNIGSVSLPLTFALADDAGFFKPGQRVGWLGIGSGLGCVMAAMEWIV